MKKVLSVVLVLAMILGSFSMVFASDFSDVKSTDANSEAINVLSGLGVIGGYADGTFRPDGIVTRAEMATMIVNALGIPVKGGAATQFSDVPASHWASGYIAYAASVGFIAGYTDGTFQPEKQVSYNEAITMIVAALGYTADSLVGTYPGAFINKATSLGILDNCKTTGTLGAVRGDIAQMLYDAADQKIGYVDKDGAWHANADKEGNYNDTMLVRLGCTEYNDGEAFVVTGEEDSDINLKPYLGAYVTAYQNSDEEIIAMAEVKSVEISGKCKEGKVAGYKTANATIGAGEVYLFENGDFKGPTDEIEFDTTTSKTYTVKLDGNYIKKVYSVLEWNAEETFQMDADMLEELEDDDTLNGHAFAMTTKDEIDTDEFAIVGVASLSDIKEDMIVTVYEADDKVVRVEVGTEVVKGKITRISDDEYTVGGKTYEEATGAKACDGSDAVDVDDEVKLFLNYAGKVALVEKIEGESHYGIVLDLGTDTGRYESSTKNFVKIYTEDGTVIEAEIDEDEVDVDDIEAATLVDYTINSKGKLIAIEAAEDEFDTGYVNAKGVVDNMEVKSSTVIFWFDAEEDDTADEDNYKVLKMADIAEQTIEGTLFVNSKSEIKAMFVTGDFVEEDDTYAIFTGEIAKQTTGDYKWVAEALYDGAKKEYAASVSLKDEIADGEYDCTSAAPVICKITWSTDGAMKAAEVADVEFVEAAVSADEKTTVVGSTFTDADGAKYSLADDITVYVYDASEDEWTVGKASSMAAAKNKMDAIYLVDFDEEGDKGYGVYDMAVVFQK